MQARDDSVCAYDGSAGHLALGGEGEVVPGRRGYFRPRGVAGDGAEERNLCANPPPISGIHPLSVTTK